jgi:hypothetical protein
VFATQVRGNDPDRVGYRYPAQPGDS